MKQWYRWVAAYPWLFIIVWPIVLSLIIVFGFNRDDIIETDVAALWVPTRTDYARDVKYIAEAANYDNITSTTFAAMAIVREEGDNLMKEEYLKKIVERMKAIEVDTKVDYKGNTFTWSDICASNNAGVYGSTYKFPCARLSSLDLFKEANWYFDAPENSEKKEETFRVAWHEYFIKNRLVRPLVPRFGIMTSMCNNPAENDSCSHAIQLRLNASYAVEQNYPEEYANPLFLLPDIQGFEMSHPCRMCIEEKLEDNIETMQKNVQAFFGLLLSSIQNNGEAVSELKEQLSTLLSPSNLDRAAIEEWFHYYTLRSIYSELGAQSYVDSYNVARFLLFAVQSSQFPDIDICPTCEVTLDEAKQILKDHADHAFSSVNTAGAPFPFWGKQDPENPSDAPFLFEGNEPFGGSGIDMSGTPFSGLMYLSQTQNNVEYGSTEWDALVETDPIYRWFIASVTPMDAGCGNDLLSITRNDTGLNENLGPALQSRSLLWCTKHNSGGKETQKYYAKMFYDLLVDNNILRLKEGVSDPYDWTIGVGCGLSLGGKRFQFTNNTETNITQHAINSVLYTIDEGLQLGAIDKSLLIGGINDNQQSTTTDPPSSSNSSVKLIQNIYPAIIGWDVVERVKNCNRPGGPILDLSYDDAQEIIRVFKLKFDEVWSEGWDDPTEGDGVQFVSFFDDVGPDGSTGRLLRELTLDNSVLTIVSIACIVVASALFLFRPNAVKSQVGITTVGVLLVVLSFFSALGFAIFLDIKINVSSAWTLPFIIIGLGVDDMYIVLLALREERDKHFATHQEEQSDNNSSSSLFVNTMSERVITPVTMTSLVNASMFAVMNMVDIPVIYKTAQAALIAVIFLYFTVAIFTFPACCYMDIRWRQDKSRADILCCIKKENNEENATFEDGNNTEGSLFYHRIYKVLILGDGGLSKLIRVIILLLTLAVTGVGVYGSTQRQTGFYLEDFFPDFHPTHQWAKQVTGTIGSFGAGVMWGDENYTDPDTQLFIMKQFEQVVETPHILNVDTKQLWIASFSLWMSRLCTKNVDRVDPNRMICGRDQIYNETTADICASTWARNKYNAREKRFGDKCSATADSNNNRLEIGMEGGVCRPTDQMHPDDLLDLGIDVTNMSDEDAEASWCPIFENFDQDKLQFCLVAWQSATGSKSGAFLKSNGQGGGEDTRTPYPDCDGEYYNDAVIKMPLVRSNGPTMFSINLNSQQDYDDLINETREVCDDVDRVRCITTGLAHSYFEQFLYIESILLRSSCAAIGIGWIVAFLFLFIKLTRDNKNNNRNFSGTKIFCGSIVAATLIAITTLLSLICVVGYSVLWNVNVTAFSTMSFLLSVGFVVEYAIHIIHRFMEAPNSTATAMGRVKYSMSFLTLPTFMAFVSSAIGVTCLAFTAFEFNNRYFFRPLITMVLITYFFGCFSLPVFLTLLDGVDVLHFGPSYEEPKKERVEEEKYKEEKADA